MSGANDGSGAVITGIFVIIASIPIFVISFSIIHFGVTAKLFGVALDFIALLSLIFSLIGVFGGILLALFGFSV